MKRCWMLLLILGCLLPAGMLLPGRAQAAAIAGLDMSARAAGAGNAFTATADDPTAMHYNPSGLAWQPGVNLAFSGALRYENMSVKQTAALGTPYNQGKFGNLAGVYGDWMPANSRVGIGFALDTPYSLRSSWGNSFGGTVQSTTLDVYHVGLDAIYEVSSSLAVAVGGDWYGARTNVDSLTTAFHGSDYASFGGHISAMWRPRPEWSFGAMLQSGATLKLNGTATGAVSGNANVKVKLPDVARIGVMHVFNDAWQLEVDASWTRWSTWKNLDVVGTTAERNPLNLRDSLGVMAGLTWFWRENTELRIGYAYDQAATKDTGFDARVVDANTHRISIGAGTELSGLHFDAAYVYAFSPNRTISSSAPYNGTYRMRRQSLALSISKHF